MYTLLAVKYLAITHQLGLLVIAHAKLYIKKREFFDVYRMFVYTNSYTSLYQEVN